MSEGVKKWSKIYMLCLECLLFLYCFILLHFFKSGYIYEREAGKWIIYI
jgi:hypothetical protein